MPLWVSDYRGSKKLEAGQEANLQASNSRPSIFPFSNVTEITTFEHQGQFNAYQYVLALAALADSSNCKIFQDTSVLKIEDGNPCIVYTAQHVVRSKHVITATHSPKVTMSMSYNCIVNWIPRIYIKLSGNTVNTFFCKF